MSQRKSVDSNNKLPAEMNDGKLKEEEDHQFDIYTQEFYLYCYNTLRNS